MVSMGKNRDDLDTNQSNRVQQRRNISHCESKSINSKSSTNLLKTENGQQGHQPETKSFSSLWTLGMTYATLMCLVFITVLSYPGLKQEHHGNFTSWLFLHALMLTPAGAHVWWYGWITAISAGLGALPLVFLRKVSSFWVGVANGLACGMMLAASICLVFEGFQTNDEHHDTVSSSFRTILGIALGGIFIYYTKWILEGYEDIHLGSLDGINARKAFLMIAVMTLHSFAEGISVGVSFGGQKGEGRGLLISTTIAIHNIPEGLAISLVLIPHGFTFLQAFLWSILSSIPQPFMAILAFFFVEQFLYVLPIGLGFAGGAMAYVAYFELLKESMEDTKSPWVSYFTVLLSGMAMQALHIFFRG